MYLPVHVCDLMRVVFFLLLLLFATTDFDKRLAQLVLRKIVKLNHGPTALRLRFNKSAFPSIDLRNTVAVIAEDQLSVFDNEHIGDHLDLFCHFKNEKTKHVAGGELRALAWLRTDGDSAVAIGAEDGTIQVVSIAHTRVVRVLRCHTTTVTDLAAHPTRDDILFSCGDDGRVCVWDWYRGECVAVWTGATASMLAVDPAGAHLALGSRSGAGVAVLDLAPAIAAVDADSPERVELAASSAKALAKEAGRCDALMYTPSGEHVVARFSTGRVIVYKADTGAKAVE